MICVELLGSFTIKHAQENKQLATVQLYQSDIILFLFCFLIYKLNS